jgi:predicted metal-binding membrane protein
MTSTPRPDAAIAIAATGAVGRDRSVGGQVSRRCFEAGSLALLLTCAMATVDWCADMAAMGELPMPGGWSLSMMWTPMCGRAWADLAASFLGRWTVMMMAMMLPALLPAWWRYRQAGCAAGARCPGWLAVQWGVGYFLVWAALGAAVFVAGAALAATALRLPMLARAASLAGAVVVLGAGALQCSAWKARRLARCRARPGPIGRGSMASLAAWRSGLRLGLHCAGSCAGLMAVLLVAGVMDMGAMILMTAAVGAERLAPPELRVERVAGAIAIAAGLAMLAAAIGAD